jgi:DNA-directed RNA polymerase subunit K/omega
MNRPTVDEILKGLEATRPEDEEEPNRYTAVMVTARRARQINSYYRSLGEGTGLEDEVAPPLITTPTRNYLTTSMEEAAQAELSFRIRPGSMGA